jgi:hypothetical protein
MRERIAGSATSDHSERTGSKNKETIQYRFNSTDGSREASVTSPKVKADDSPATGCGGRPRTGEAEQRNEHILRVADEIFMEFGFDGTSMDAVAEAARISKRTLYARYADKAALFHAVLSDLISRWLVPIDRFQTEQGEIEDISCSLSRVT